VPHVPPRPTVSADDLRALCLVRAFEQVDRDGLILSGLERERASRRALLEPEQVTDPAGRATFLVRRAQELAALSGERASSASALLAASRADLPALGLALAALAVGLATNAQQGRRISVLAFPLLGALLWNLAVYAALLVQAARGARATASAPARGLVLRSARALISSRLRRRLLPARAETAALEVGAAGVFAELWLSSASALIGARLRRALHLAAALLVAGMVAGMYLRGLVLEYRATWESTFLGERAVQTVTDIVLGPARALSGIATPPLASLRAPASADAAPWIHLWALTALIVVILPRLLLWGLDTLRSRSLARALPLDLEEPYYRRLLAPVGAGVRVELAPYATRLTPRAGEVLRELAHDLFGARADVVQRAALDYGSPADVLTLEGAGACAVLVFNLAQTPELEVQARFLGELSARLSASQRLLVVIDGGAYAERLGADTAAQTRLAERRRTWDRAAREAQLPVLHLDLSAPLDEDALARAGAALWTASARARVP
jgi:hypothetical protein